MKRASFVARDEAKKALIFLARDRSAEMGKEEKMERGREKRKSDGLLAY